MDHLAAMDKSPTVAVVSNLLQTAGQTLATDRMSAKRLIDQAIALLKLHPESTPAPVREDPLPSGLAPWQVRRVSEFIDKHLASSLSTFQLARVVNLSTGYFCHAFKRSFGMTAHTYVMGKRVERAQGLMLTTNEPLSQIALSCGLADQSHLSRVFRRSLGRSPSTWRRQYRVHP